MTTLLRIDASAQLEERSLTRKLTGLFIQEFLSTKPEACIITRDVGQTPIPAIDHQFIHAAFTPPKEQESWMRERLTLSDTLVDEIEEADIIVMGVPMYNYGLPTSLKGWIDHIARINRTFTFDLTRGDFPIEPVLRDKKLVVLSSRGEFGFGPGQIRGHLNTLDPAIAACSHYFGVKSQDIQSVAIEYQEFKDMRHKQSIAAAEVKTREFARNLANLRLSE